MSELRDAINEMRTMRESYDSLIESSVALSPDVAQSKAALATAITSKGVQTASTDSLATMAEKVQEISQDTIEIDGGEMYAKQLYGSLTTPNYWNLYEVLANLLSDGRFVNYGGILLAEYYKGYDSIALSGAGAGGGYVTSDGQYYTEDVTHYWNDDLDGKGNRWVAYLFATEGHGFQITDTNTSPRSIHIGRHVGVIESLVNGRISEIVVPDGSTLDDFRGEKTQNWGQRIVMSVANHQSGSVIYAPQDTINSYYIKVAQLTGGMIINNNERSNSSYSPAIIFDCAETLYAPKGTPPYFIGNLNDEASAMRPNVVIWKGLKDCRGICLIRSSYGEVSGGTGIMLFPDLERLYSSTMYAFLSATWVKKMYFPVIEDMQTGSDENGQSYGNPLFTYGGSLAYIYIGYKTNDHTKSIILSALRKKNYLVDIELKAGYKKNIDVSQITDVLTAENIALHMLDRLATNDTGGTLTLKLGATNLATIQNDSTYSSYLTAATNKGWTITA